MAEAVDGMGRTVDEALGALQIFKNVVLFGPPGTGKTYARDRIAAAWLTHSGRHVVTAGTMKDKDGNDRSFPFSVTLHPSTTYEEFVEGLRYDDTKGIQRFVLQPGFVRLVVEAARSDPDRDYLILIDELNRANVPKVFGDLLLTVEASKRAQWNGTEWVDGTPVTLPYSGLSFEMPSNVYLLGTMNSSDRSIAPLDAALRRRFAFVSVEPLSGDQLLGALASEYDVDEATAEMIWKPSVGALDTINDVLTKCLGPDSRLGHSYLFVDPSSLEAELETGALGEVFWMTTAGRMDTGSQLQFPATVWSNAFLPGVGFADPMQVPTAQGSAGEVVTRFRGRTYTPAITRNSANNTIRLSKNGEGESALPMAELTGHIALFRPISGTDRTMELVVVPLSRADALWRASRPGQRPKEGEARTWGVIPAQPKQRDRLWWVWRYAILPQLIETVTQAYAAGLLVAGTRRAEWLTEASFEQAARAKLEAALAQFDAFLAQSLGLTIVEEGRGMTRGLAVIEAAPGPEAAHAGPKETGGGDKAQTEEPVEAPAAET
ncbi:McrB family protein [Agromyces mariniharenae]|uniref:AAA domain-containing protein n=1 Tax=Agromyces mariniharenae TaxID=2604423 RepID=A0A5S4V8I7_9MICO|nr:AAA family ATPase [Agromyces mariniharenae]TYL50425.1 AAA domain-containing protein [Agromyces mariniharenae]